MMSASTARVDTLAYRKTIGLFATGVTVILAERDGQIHGMTANSVTSVSLEPTLVLVCPSKQANMARFLTTPEAYFTINILSEEQELLSNYFARWRGQDEPPAYRLIPWPAAGNVPRLDGCLGALACRVYRIYEGGDHWIVVGEVVDLYRSEGPYRPLLFFAGEYHQLRRQEPEHVPPSADPYR